MLPKTSTSPFTLAAVLKILAAQSLPVEVVNKLKQLPGITDAHVDIVWDPPWDKDRMSDAAKLQLGMW